MSSIQRLAAVAILLASPIHGMKSLQEPGSRQCTVRGRIEISNPHVKLRGGVTDASGIAVWLLPLKAEPDPPAAALPRGRIEQRDKRFIPHVTVIQVGTEIDFPNRDPFFHNVFSTFDGKTFDLGLYANGESRPVRFNRPGVSFLYCNIHPQMSAIIVTVETPYFSSSARDGNFTINDVPVGRYELRVWHERSDPQQLEAERRVLSLGSPVTELGVIRLDEASYIPKAHKNKHGEDYADKRKSPYRRP
jgi:plastocyanin